MSGLPEKLSAITKMGVSCLSGILRHLARLSQRFGATRDFAVVWQIKPAKHLRVCTRKRVRSILCYIRRVWNPAFHEVTHRNPGGRSRRYQSWRVLLLV